MRKFRSAPRSGAASAVASREREVEPEVLECVREAGLRYVSDGEPGITRKGAGKRATYFAPSGRRITAPRELARLRRLAIPPA